MRKENNARKGFTLVELIVVLVILALLATFAGGGIISYVRLARFERNEANARTIYQSAQTALTRLEMSGDLTAFLGRIKDNAKPTTYQPTEAPQTEDEKKFAEDVNKKVYAIFFNKGEYENENRSAQAQILIDLIDDYVYDKSLLDASICLEVDVESGQVFAAFYDTVPKGLAFDKNATGKVTDITNRSYEHRRNDSLVGYYSTDDLVNVVTLASKKLRVNNPKWNNNETLTLTWSSNSITQDSGVAYSIRLFNKVDDTPLMEIEVDLDYLGSAFTVESQKAELRVWKLKGTGRGERDGEPQSYWFPLTRSGAGVFTLTFDAMMSAELLQTNKELDDADKTMNFSITRFGADFFGLEETDKHLDLPKMIYAQIQAAPNESGAAIYTASSWEKSQNDTNTLFADDFKAEDNDKYTLQAQCFRHLYNLRWLKETNTAKMTMKFKGNDDNLDWTDGSVVVYQMAESDNGTQRVTEDVLPYADTPTVKVNNKAAHVVAFPTVPHLGKNVTLTSDGKAKIYNLQLNNESVAKDRTEAGKEYAAQYVGLFGRNDGTIENLTFQDADVIVNVQPYFDVDGDDATRAARTEEAVRATLWGETLGEDVSPLSGLRGVGLLCGLNTGKIENVTTTNSTTGRTRVVAAVPFGNDPKNPQGEDAETLLSNGTAITVGQARGIGGLVGISRGTGNGDITKITTAGQVVGLLLDRTETTVTVAEQQKAVTADDSSEAKQHRDAEDAFRPVGIGGIIGTVQIPQGTVTNFTNEGAVTGNGYTGGIFGTALGSTDDKNQNEQEGNNLVELRQLNNTGLVTVSQNWAGGTTGQFFGGLIGYANTVRLNESGSTPGNGKIVLDEKTGEVTIPAEVSITSETVVGVLKQQEDAGDRVGLLRGDFVGGLIGFGNGTQIRSNCTIGKNGLTVGRRYVGGFVGAIVNEYAIVGSSTEDGNVNKNEGSVFGWRYVGGIAAINGGREEANIAHQESSEIANAINRGLVAAIGDDAAYVGGVVGYNTAKLTGCSNVVRSDNSEMLQKIGADHTDFVGGIVGYNAPTGAIMSLKEINVMLVGRDFVGGVVGYQAVKEDNDGVADVMVQHTINVTGRIYGRNFVGGVVGLSQFGLLPNAIVETTDIAGEYFVGGVIGAQISKDITVLSDSMLQTGATAGTRGTIESVGVAGGLIGYLQIAEENTARTSKIDAKTEAERLREVLSPTLDENLVLHGNPNLISTNTVGEISAVADTRSKESGKAKSLLNYFPIRGVGYLGGLIGAVEENSHIVLEYGKNHGALTYDAQAAASERNPITGDLRTGVSVQTYLAQAGDLLPDDTKANFMGGVVGVNTQYATLKHCTNRANINGQANAIGGIAGLNEGTIQSCVNEINLGSTTQSQVGGIAGINVRRSEQAEGGKLENCNLGNITVSGNADVGGFVGLNLKNTTLNSGTTQAAVLGNTNVGGLVGRNFGAVDGFTISTEIRVTATERAGGAVGYNAVGGTVGTTNKVEVQNVTVRSTKDYAGGIVGYNEGTMGKQGEQEASLVCSGSTNVTTTNQYAGGIAGYNKGTIYAAQNTTSGSIAANNQFAGGITGFNATGATLDQCAQTGGGSIIASAGAAGGLAAVNKGTIENSSVQSGTVTGNNCTYAGAAVSQNDGTMKAVTIPSNANVKLAGNTVQTIGALAGENTATIDTCTVAALPDRSNITGTGLTLGGIVGLNEGSGSVKNSTASFSLTSLDRYATIGGVAGINKGTGTGESKNLVGGLHECAFTGSIKDMGNTGLTNVGDMLGGIVGYNETRATVTGCKADSPHIELLGVYRADPSDTAENKVSKASSVGGIVGRNDGTIAECTVGSDKQNAAGNLIAVRYGFVGGIAGVNFGTVMQSGSSNDLAKQLVKNVNNWLADIAGNTELNNMVEQLTGNVYTELRGVDTIYYDVTNRHSSDAAFGDAGKKNYTIRYTKEVLAHNDLMIALRGSDAADMLRSSKADGYLGGIVGYNTVDGSVQDSVSGKWFVYGDNVSMTTYIGGVIGQNESNVNMSGLVNCAMVRRFNASNKKLTRGQTSVTSQPQDKTEWDHENNYSDAEGLYFGESNSTAMALVPVGGVIGNQQNKTSDQWQLTNCVNYGGVYNSRSAYMGGVIGYWQNNGGTLQHCFNFGTLKTNSNPNVIRVSTVSGTGAAGGIVSLFANPTSGGTVNVLSCQNHGNIEGAKAPTGNGYFGPNDIAGIFGKMEMINASDTMTINIIDCVNGRVKMQGYSMICGIFSWLGPYETNIHNVTVNIDRCRNYCVDMAGLNGTTLMTGIYGSRGKPGAKTKSGTSITNCFTLYNPTFTGQWQEGTNMQGGLYYPIFSYYGYRNAAEANWENLTFSNNYYMDAPSIENRRIVSLLLMKENAYGPAFTGYSAIGWDAEGENAAIFGQRRASGNRGKFLSMGGTRLYAGKNNTTGQWFAAKLLEKTVPEVADTNNAWTRLQRLDARDNKIVTNSAGYQSIVGDDGTARADLLLNFADTGNGTVGFEDITDEVIQNYYTNILDLDPPKDPQNVKVSRSGEGDGKDVYGSYTVSWEMSLPNNATHYEVKLYVQLEEGGEFVEQDSFLAYEKRYVFDVNDKDWQGKQFYVTVQAKNSQTASAAVESGKYTFATALPTPVVSILQTKPGNNTMERYLVLKNYADYPTNVTCTVTAELVDVNTQSVTLDKFVLDTDTGLYRYKLPSNWEKRNTTLNVSVAPPSGNTDWMRSAQYTAPIAIGADFTSCGSATKSEVTLNTATATDISNLEITLKHHIAASYADTLYDMMIVGQAKEGTKDEANDIDLGGQWVVLAHKEYTLPGEETTITIKDLPADLLDYCATDAQGRTKLYVYALPLSSGLGPVYNYAELDAAKVKTKIDGGQTLGEGANEYEIIRGEDGTYSYRRMYSRVSANADSKYYVMRQQFLKKYENSVLNDPTYEITDSGLEYTFSWQEIEGATFKAELAGLIHEGDETREVNIPLPEEWTNGTQKNQFTVLADEWNFNEVRLTVTRVGGTGAGTESNPLLMGSVVSKDYDLVKRLPQVSAPVMQDADTNKTELLYNISWPGIDNAYLDDLHHYVVYAAYETQNEDGETVTKLDQIGTTETFETQQGEGDEPVIVDTTDNTVTQLSVVNMEIYAGMKLDLYVVAMPNEDSAYVQSPKGVTLTVEMPTRNEAPKADRVSLSVGDRTLANATGEYVSLAEFRNNLTVNLQLANDSERLQGNYRMGAYFLENEDDLTELQGLIAAAEATDKTPSELLEAEKALNGKLEALLNATVEGTEIKVNDSYGLPDGVLMEVDQSGKHLSYTLTNLNYLNHARYLVVRVRAVPNSGTASKWHYITYKIGDTMAKMPGIRLDTPALKRGTTTVALTGDLFVNQNFADAVGELKLESANLYTADWNPVELADGYSLTWIGKDGTSSEVEIVLNADGNIEKVVKHVVHKVVVPPEGMPINEEYFPDEVFRAAVKASADTDNNGYLTADELKAKTITAAGTEESKVHSLQGLEYFLELEELDISSNNLTNLDLSANTKLTKLNASGNQLEEVNINQNTELIELDLSSNDTLSQLDLGANTNLTEVNVAGDNLTELDVSKNTALTNLNVSGNHLTYLDLSANASLTTVNVEANTRKVAMTGNTFDLKDYVPDASKVTLTCEETVATKDENGVVTVLQQDVKLLDYTYDTGSPVEGVAKLGFEFVLPEGYVVPTPEPTPTTEPSATPTTEPSATPSAEPTTEPSATPPTAPSATPSATPSTEPSATPPTEPSATPTVEPVPTEENGEEPTAYYAAPAAEMRTVTEVTTDNGVTTYIDKYDIELTPQTDETGTVYYDLSETRKVEVDEYGRPQINTNGTDDVNDDTIVYETDDSSEYLQVSNPQLLTGAYTDENNARLYYRIEVAPKLTKTTVNGVEMFRVLLPDSASKLTADDNEVQKKSERVLVGATSTVDVEKITDSNRAQLTVADGTVETKEYTEPVPQDPPAVTAAETQPLPAETAVPTAAPTPAPTQTYNSSTAELLARLMAAAGRKAVPAPSPAA